MSNAKQAQYFQNQGSHSNVISKFDDFHMTFRDQEIEISQLYKPWL